MKSWDVRRQESEHGTGRTEMPSRARLEQELGSLDIHGMGDTGISFGADGETAKESHGKEEAMKRMRKEAEIARLSKMMQEKNERKAADQARIERMILARAEAQRQANGASTSVDIPITARSEDESPKSEKTAGNTPKEVQKTIEREKSNASVLSKEDQKMLKKIKTDGRKEGIRVAEAEKDEKDRLAAREQKERANTQENEHLEADLFGGLIENSGAPELPKNKLPEEVPRKTKSSKTVRRVPKEPVRRVVEHSSEESDSSEPTKKVKPKLKTPVKIRRKMSLADLLAARKARRESQSETEKPGLPDKPSTASKEVGEKPATESKAEDGKLSKSDEFVAENDLKHDTKDEVKLPSDALNTEKVSVEITETDTIVVSGDESGNAKEATIETTTLAVEVQQQETSVERTEVTETTTVVNSSEGEMTVERSTHVEAITATSIPEQELPDTSSASTTHEPQDGASSPVEDYSSRSHPTPPAKRKRSFTATEPQLNPETPSNLQTELPSSKKRKFTSPVSPTEHPAAAPTSILSVSEPTVPPPEPSASAPETHNNPPASPGAASVASPTSSSPSKKRKMTEDGDEMVSAEETKRVKHVHDGEIPAGGEVEGESVESGESSDDSFDSLFDE
ncbi:hypothetical protein C7974DRAFT_415063 [Boeremia exigua]|uniref:uncharacterized protein n=1 Tax=Boeremia exigua TaxID=749465 RepID=UPI001E8E33DC|nr:uncharacterized protein C7974DRAFT_415063 [Boeremia exigua]KAH6622411.1 hypothetical protein C7974DRAFT_415063 [Boeremia exigua]